MNKTYNEDSRWHWSKTAGPMEAINNYVSFSNDKKFTYVLDHPDRQKLEDGSWEYTAHPYISEAGSLETAGYQNGVDALAEAGWDVTLTGSETSEYAHKHRASGCWTKRLSIIRKPLGDRIQMAEALTPRIEELTEAAKSLQKACEFTKAAEARTERDYLKRMKTLLLRRA